MSKILIKILSLCMPYKLFRHIFYRWFLYHLPYRGSGVGGCDHEHGYGLFGPTSCHSGPYILFEKTHCEFRKDLSLRPTYMEPGFRFTKWEDGIGKTIFQSEGFDSSKCSKCKGE